MDFLKNLGVILVIFGALILVAYIFAPSNVLLFLALGIEVLGIILHIVLNRKLS